MNAAFTTAHDEELCRQITRRACARFVTGIIAIISLHRSMRTNDEKRCGMCKEAWPCRTVMLAVGIYQEKAQ